MPTDWQRPLGVVGRLVGGGGGEVAEARRRKVMPNAGLYLQGVLPGLVDRVETKARDEDPTTRRAAQPTEMCVCAALASSLVSTPPSTN